MLAASRSIRVQDLCEASFRNKFRRHFVLLTFLLAGIQSCGSLLNYVVFDTVHGLNSCADK